MKIANVTLLFKKGDRQDSRNSIISTLSAFFKILKTFIHDRLKCFVNKHNISSEAQKRLRKIK
jgi:hypothetical protein